MVFASIYNLWNQNVENLGNMIEFIKLIFIVLRNDIYNFDEFHMDNLKQKVINNGPISIKFMQWYLTKKMMENEDGKYTNIIDKFENIFDNCPYHSLEESKSIFLNDFGRDISEMIDMESLVEVGSGSIGQVYKGKLIDGTEVAIKIKHPNIERVTRGQLYVINMLISLQKFSFLKKLLQLHIDIEDFMYNLLLQLDFSNEVYNTLKFERYFSDNKLIVIPKVRYYSPNIIISNYESGLDFDELSSYQKSKVGLNFYCMIVKMNLFFDFTHGDLHKKNWKVRFNKNTKEHQIILYDFGIIFETNFIEKNKKLWNGFETNNSEIVFECLPYMLIDDKKQKPVIHENLKKDIEEIFSTHYSCGVVINSLLKILNENKLYINRIFLNILITIVLIEKIFLEIDFINRFDPPNSEKRMRNIASRYGDVYAFCKKYPFYKDVENYVGEHFNNYQVDNLFVNHNSKLEFDDPLEL